MANTKQADERDDVQKGGADQEQARGDGRYEGGRGSDQDRQAKQVQDQARKQGDGEKGRKPAMPSQPDDMGRRGMEEEE